LSDIVQPAAHRLAVIREILAKLLFLRSHPTPWNHTAMSGRCRQAKLTPRPSTVALEDKSDETALANVPDLLRALQERPEVSQKIAATSTQSLTADR
jgi:hypothetical protein